MPRHHPCSRWARFALPLLNADPVRLWVCLAQQIMYCAFGGLAALIGSGWWITVSFGGIYAPVPLLLVAIWYNFIYIRPVPGDTAKYITFHDAALEKKYGKVRAARAPCALARSVSPRCCRRRRTRSPSPYCTRLTLTATSSSRAMFWSAHNPFPPRFARPTDAGHSSDSVDRGWWLRCAGYADESPRRVCHIHLHLRPPQVPRVPVPGTAILQVRLHQASHPPLSNPQLHAWKLMGRCRRRRPHHRSCCAQL